MVLRKERRDPAPVHASQNRATAAERDGTRPGEHIFNRVGFEQFWAVYPRKVARIAAIKAWNKIKPDDGLVRQMLETIGWQRATRQWREGFIPHPTTYLNQGRYLDERDEPVTSTAWQCPHKPKCDERWRCYQRSELDAMKAGS